jgi:hypothetical protein
MTKELKPTRFTINSSLALAADSYTAEFATTEEFVEANTADRVTLEVGYVRDGQPVRQPLIREGPIDKYEASITPDGVAVTVTGRCAMSRMQDTQIAVQYMATAPATTVSGENTVTQKIGRYWASTIARETCAAAGLTLLWECRDYVIEDRFDAVGRAFDVIQALLEPWNQTAALGVDILIEGLTLICRARSLTPTVPPQNQFRVADAKLKSISVQKFLTPNIGQVVLTGAVIPVTGAPLPPLASRAFGQRRRALGADGRPRTTVVASSATSAASLALAREALPRHQAGQAHVRLAPRRESPAGDGIEVAASSATYNPDTGALQGMTITKSYYSDPPHTVLLQQTKETMSFDADAVGFIGRSGEVLIENTWDWGLTPKDQPKQLGEETTTKGWIVEDGVKRWVVKEYKYVGYAYDALRFLTAQTTVTYKRNQAGVLEGTDWEDKSYSDDGPLYQKVRTETYVMNKRDKVWILVKQDIQPGSGLRPGGIISGGKPPTPEPDPPDPIGFPMPPNPEIIPTQIRWQCRELVDLGSRLGDIMDGIVVTADAAHLQIGGPSDIQWSPDPDTLADKSAIMVTKTWKRFTIYATEDSVMVGDTRFKCTVPGTSGGLEPRWPSDGAVEDGTVTWNCEPDVIVLRAYYPGAPAGYIGSSGGAVFYGPSEATCQVRVDGLSHKKIRPEIRWDPDPVAPGEALAPACNATAVTPDEAHLPVDGVFTYTPPATAIASPDMIRADPWIADTIYASGAQVSGDGRVWRCTTPGTSGGDEPTWPAKDAKGHTPSVDDFTVVWQVQETDVTITADFAPTDTEHYEHASATQTVNVTDEAAGKITPEIRWEPEPVAPGDTLAAACNATAVTPDEAHLPVDGVFTYNPPATAIASPGLIAGEPWAAQTVYASADQVLADGRAWKCTVPGTTGASEPTWPPTPTTGSAPTVSDGTVIWTLNLTDVLIEAVFTPDDQDTYRTASAMQWVNVTAETGKIRPEIRWTPGAVGIGEVIDPALNATAVTPDEAHTPIDGTFSYSLAPGTIAGPDLIVATKAWAAATVFAAGDAVDGGGRVWEVTTPGTTGGTEPTWPTIGTTPVSDGTVVWHVNETSVHITATFTPTDGMTYSSAEAAVSVTVSDSSSSKIKPEIRWTPGPVALGGTIDAALNASAVTPDEAHLPVAGTFVYTPGSGTIAGPDLITATKAWAATTIFASGDSVYGDGRVWRVREAGTTGGSEPTWPPTPAEGATPTVTDGTVIWERNGTDAEITARFTPTDAATYRTAEAIISINVVDSAAGKIKPEIRWDPGAVGMGAPIDAALNATAVTPDEAHTPVAGTFSYSPGPGTIAGPDLITASKAWAAGTVFAAGDSVSGDGRVWVVSEPGTSGGSEPTWPPTPSSGPTPEVPDGTVVWRVNATDVTITAVFTPSDATIYATVTATQSINVMEPGGGKIAPEIRWTPGGVGPGDTLAAACNATAVTPDEAHLPVDGVFTYTPDPASGVSADLITANKAWAATTIFGGGDSVAGGGRVWRVSTPGTSGGSEPAWPAPSSERPTVPDGTVEWGEQLDVEIRAVFIPDDAVTYQQVDATRLVSLDGLRAGPEPEIRWDPPSTILPGASLDPALNATAVTPDEAHTLMTGVFSYSIPAGTTADLSQVSASRGPWQSGTIYASGDRVAAGGKVWRCTTPGTSGGIPPVWPVPTEPPTTGPVADGTVIWTDASAELVIGVTFQPDDATYRTATAERTISLQGSTPGSVSKRYQIIKRISEDPAAPAFQYSNSNLMQEDLAFIFSQLERTSGLWQWEQGCVGINVPWLRRGSVFQLTECPEDLALPPMLLETLQLDYQEGESVTRDMKARAWTPDSNGAPAFLRAPRTPAARPAPTPTPSPRKRSRWASLELRP